MDCLKCSICQKPIYGKSLRDKDKHFHFSCVNCFRCKQPMKGYVKFKNHKFFHGRCFRCVDCDEDCFQQTSILTPKGLKCFSCGIPCFLCGKDKPDLTVSSLSNSFLSCYVHSDCYQCSKCGLLGIPLISPLKYQKGKLEHDRCSPEKCVVCFQTLGPDSCIKMGFPVHMNKGCINRNKCWTCSKYVIPIHQLWSHQWSVETHTFFSLEVQKAIFQLFLIWNFRESEISKLPRDIFYLLCRKVATIEGWKTINGVTVDIFCFPGRCARQTHCGICLKPYPLTKDETKCSPHTKEELSKCVLYRCLCYRCGEKVRHDQSPETSCTNYRCLEDECILCKGEMKFGPEDIRDLCDKTKCKIYSGRCNCGEPILRVHINPEKECTTYRCLKEPCKICGLTIQASPTSSGCSFNFCKTLSKEVQNLEKFLDKHLNVPDNCFSDSFRKQHYRLVFSELLSTEREDLFLISNALSRWEEIIEKQ